MHIIAVCSLSAGIAAVLSASAQAAPGHDHAARGEVGGFAQQALRPSESFVESAPPLWDNLGTLSYKVTTTSQRAQKYFDQGLRLTYAFNHTEARRAFRMAQRLDPKCALCSWGEALVLGPNINAPMDSAAVKPALAALREAQEKARYASGRERALIEALGRRYSESAERATLDAAYATAMNRVAARYPEDEDIQILYAEALMDLTPWDYWASNGRRPKGRTAEILAVLERVLDKHPDHPGAIHYYIHMVEASDRPERAEPYARRLADLMPGAGHLVHMPFHIYFRMGRYLDALAVNRAGVAADEAYIAAAAPEGIYPHAYYPHNVHSLMAAAQMAGDGKTAIAAAEKLARVVSLDAARTIPWVQPIQAAPYFAHAQFSAPETVWALRDPGSSLPYVQAMWHYARGVAHASRKDIQAAERAAAAIAARADFSALTAGGIPAGEVLALARHVLLARIAQARGALKAACTELERAVAIQDKLPYMEPPYWYYPVRQSLGAVLLLSGDLGGAEDAFRASLGEAPHNGWALYGLTEVYKRRGDKHQARVAERRLAEAWAGDRAGLDLSRL
ncbi:MAG: hypothetical protein ACREXS_09925 [Gammaproteobacteria bacterium]